MKQPTELKIRYRGKLMGSKWLYSAPRVVELPIPFISRSEKQGEVICRPYGIFPYADGKRLLEMSGENGPFVLEEEIFSRQTDDEVEEIEVPVGPGTSVITTSSNPPAPVAVLGAKPIARFRGRRRSSKRKVRSDKGLPKPRNSNKPASIPESFQADAEAQAPSPA